MTTRSKTLRHLIGGGWASDFGPTVDVTPDESGKVIIPHLIDAENVLYKLNGGFQKIGGTTRVNSTQITSGGSGTVITGLYDYWKQGTAGSPVRRRVLHSDTRVLSDTDDGSFTTEVFTGLESLKVVSYSTFDDLLIISSDSNTDVPKSWDQTTAQDLAGSPPNFAFSASHKNRQWAAGVVANPSKLYYSANVDPEDWTGSGSGNIDIDPNDGDIITGIASHRNELWVFKGPYKGSIHRITGSSPSDFARTTFINGLGAAWHNGIVSFSNDLGFIAHDGTFRSLAATDAFGDFLEASLSRPIHTWLKDHLNYSRLKNIWTVDDPGNSRIFITASIDSSTTNNVVLMMDYRFKPFRWAQWSAIEAGSLNFFEDTSSFKRVLIGGNDGYVRRVDIVDRSIDTLTAIAAKVTTPYLNYGLPLIFKNISQASIGIAPKGNYNATFGWTRDDNSQQTQTFAQDGGDVLAPATNNEFTLGTSTLSGAQFVDRHMELEEGGSFRSIQYQLTQSGLNEDLEVHAISATISPEAVSTEN